MKPAQQPDNGARRQPRAELEQPSKQTRTTAVQVSRSTAADQIPIDPPGPNNCGRRRGNIEIGHFFDEPFPRAAYENSRVSGAVQHNLRVALCLPKSGRTDYLWLRLFT